VRTNHQPPTTNHLPITNSYTSGFIVPKILPLGRAIALTALLMKILVVEDELKVATFLRRGLEEKGYAVDIATDGNMAEQMISLTQYQLILLDVILPHQSGIVVCRKIKAAQPDVPVLMLTALGTTEDKLGGFDAGVDDYLVKPFEFAELLARIRALTKRSQPSLRIEPSRELVVSDLVLDLDRKSAVRAGKTINLTAKEFALLEHLMRNKGRVVSRADIAESVWEVTFDTGTNVVEVYVNILRKKIDKDFQNKLIHTRIGLGYVMEDQS
jgi:two-component system, OmpR family, copper resistance phosphate regulon response regulator CusR